jgi:regulator of cell morphogenesis and NO signaling
MTTKELARPFTIDHSTSVGQIARAVPATIGVFESMDIDYACKGGRALAEAAETAGFDPAVVIDALERVIDGDPQEDESCVTDLVHRLLLTDHAGERERLTSIKREIDAAIAAGPEVPRIRHIMEKLGTLILDHMKREERELFPRIELLAEARDRGTIPVPGGSLGRRLFVEFVEHDVIHERLMKLRELRLKLALRDAAPARLLDLLLELEHATLRHMHIENNVLFPRALELEHELKQA